MLVLIARLGVFNLSNVFINTERQPIAVRLLIGICGLGFYPTGVSYLSLFYPVYDLVSPSSTVRMPLPATSVVCEPAAPSISMGISMADNIYS